MKIVSTELPIRHAGTIRASMMVADDFLGWNPTMFPVYDLLDELKPDLVFIGLQYVTSTVVRAFNENKHTKVVLFGQGVPRGFLPDIVVVRPDTSPVLRKNIESEEYTTLYQHDSANIVDVWGGNLKDKLQCDIGYVFDDQNPEAYVPQILLITELSKIANTKVIGSKKISLPNYLGNLGQESLSGFFRTPKMLIDWNGEHILDIAANGGFCLPTVDNRLFPQLDRARMADQIKELLDKEKARQRTARRAQKLVLGQDTCYHRIIEIFETLGWDEAAEKTKEQLEEKLSCVQE